MEENKIFISYCNPVFEKLMLLVLVLIFQLSFHIEKAGKIHTLFSSKETAINLP